MIQNVEMKLNEAFVCNEIKICTLKRYAQIWMMI